MIPYKNVHVFKDDRANVQEIAETLNKGISIVTVVMDVVNMYINQWQSTTTNDMINRHTLGISVFSVTYTSYTALEYTDVNRLSNMAVFVRMQFIS